MIRRIHGLIQVIRLHKRARIIPLVILLLLLVNTGGTTVSGVNVNNNLITTGLTFNTVENITEIINDISEISNPCIQYQSIHCGNTFAPVVNTRFTGENITFHAQDTWKAHNGIDDDLDNVTDFDENDWDEAIYLVNATCTAVSGNFSLFIDREQLYRYSTVESEAIIAEIEDNVYPVIATVFGVPPDKDYDGSVIILGTDLRDAYYHGDSSQGIDAGYFWPLQSYPTGEGIYSYSDHCEIVYIDTRVLDNSPIQTAEIVSHELQHLVHYDKDSSEELWLDEGFSMLAQRLTGHRGDITYKINMYNAHPGTSLTYFNGGHEAYGTAYLFALYLLERYGETAISNTVTNNGKGLAGVTAALASIGNVTNPHALYFDYMAAVAADSYSPADESMRINGENIYPEMIDIDPVNVTVVDSQLVESWGSIFYRLPLTDCPGQLFIQVEGQPTDGYAQASHYFVTVLEIKNNAVNKRLFAIEGKSGSIYLPGHGVTFTEAVIMVSNLAGITGGTLTIIPPRSNVTTAVLWDNTTMEIPGSFTYYPSNNELECSNWQYYDEAGMEWSETDVAITTWKAVYANGKETGHGGTLMRTDDSGWTTGMIALDEVHNGKITVIATMEKNGTIVTMVSDEIEITTGKKSGVGTAELALLILSGAVITGVVARGIKHWKNKPPPAKEDRYHSTVEKMITKGNFWPEKKGNGADDIEAGMVKRRAKRRR